MVRKIATGLLGVFAGLLTVVAFAAPAYAHNSLTSSDPKDGAKLAKAPETVRLTFLARLDPENTTVTITGPDGQPAVEGAPRFDKTKVTISLRPGAAGVYTVAYQVGSSDGHPVKGKVRFTLTTAVEPTTVPTSASPTPSPTPSDVPAAPATDTVSLTSTATPSDGGTPWWPWALGAVGLLAVVGIGAGVLRRRSNG